MKTENRLIKAFGKNEAGLADLPRRISGTLYASIKVGDSFPEDIHRILLGKPSNWKHYRKKQWKFA